MIQLFSCFLVKRLNKTDLMARFLALKRNFRRKIFTINEVRFFDSDQRQLLAESKLQKATEKKINHRL